MQGYILKQLLGLYFLGLWQVKDTMAGKKTILKVNVGPCFLGKEDEGEIKDCPSTALGEGGETGELVPGKSLVFAAMELLVFILVRHLPQLNTRVKESPSHAALRPQQLPGESACLVANTVSILAELPLLCSPAGETWSNTHTHTHTHTVTHTHT